MENNTFPQLYDSSISPEKEMISQVPLPEYEEERLASLKSYHILDTAPDLDLDQITALAASTLKTPFALVTMIDKDRQWFKSKYGIEVKESSREVGFCPYAILNTKGPLIIPDTLQDPLFAKNQFVIGKPFIRFYAGIPLLSRDGFPIGCFCIFDQNPRIMLKDELLSLEKFASLAMASIERHRGRMEIICQLPIEKEVYYRLLVSSVDLAAKATTFDDALHTLLSHLDPNLGWLSARVRNMQTGGTTGIYYNESVTQKTQLKEAWNIIDSTPSHSLGEFAHTEFISSSPLNPDFSHLVVPVSIRDRLIAVMEFLYPDHRQMNPRIREVFDLMASNLSVLAERELVAVELRHQATHDFLTDTASRPVIIKELQKTLQTANLLHPDSVLFYFDLDDFKDVNDSFGHQIGDALLKELSRRLKVCCRESDLVGRLSGDEFIILVRNINIDRDLNALKDRLQACFTDLYIFDDLEIKVICSIGGVVINDPDITPLEILNRAEAAMYLVKQGGHEGICLVNPQILRELEEKHNWDKKIKVAMEKSQFLLFYQPIIDLSTRLITGVEALLRLKQDNGEVIAATSFLPTLERLQLLSKIDGWVFAKTVELISGTASPLQTIKCFRFSINISPSTLSSNNFAKRCIQQLEQAQVSPTSIVLEIIENSLFPTSPTLIENLNILRAVGILIAVDDFGTGYSNLQHLSNLPIDIIKIDKNFLSGIEGNNHRMNNLLVTIVNIAKNIDCKIVAEGVETEAQSLYLKSLCCDYGQGYLYGRPMPIEQILELAKDQFSLFVDENPLYQSNL